MTTETAETNADTDENASDFFRCPVQADQGAATIRVGRRKISVTVQETSIDGFTVLVPPESSNRLSVGKPWILMFDDGRYEVHAQWFFHAPDGHVQVGMRRLRDLTEPVVNGSGWWPFSGGDLRGSDDGRGPALAFFGFVLCLVCALALPGLGDQLGTSKPMGTAFRSLLTGIGDFFQKLI